MLELELDAIEKLLVVYSQIYTRGISLKTSKFAKAVYDEFVPAHTLLSNDVNLAVGKLFSVAYINVDKDRAIPSKEEIKQILQKLRRLKSSLEK